MNKQLIAIRDGKYDHAIKLATDCLDKDPHDIASHFTLAQAFESKGTFRKALEHALVCLDSLPDSFEALSISARCAAKSELYDDAYKYAEKAIKDSRDPNIPPAVNALSIALSYLPGLKTLRGTNESVVGAYANQTQWLRDYCTWYEGQSSIKQRPPTQ